MNNTNTGRYARPGSRSGSSQKMIVKLDPGKIPYIVSLALCILCILLIILDRIIPGEIIMNSRFVKVLLLIMVFVSSVQAFILIRRDRAKRFALAGNASRSDANDEKPRRSVAVPENRGTA